MKKLKQIIAELQSIDQDTDAGLMALLWQYICYPPKMPVRLQQQQLLDEAEAIALKVYDQYFSKTELQFNTFKWGTGKHIILLTHGWGSKAADLSEIIAALRPLDDVQIVAFDLPGNGSSEGDLGNLLLFVEAVKTVIAYYGQPDIMIGHSLGAMANVMTLVDLQFMPKLLISITPLVKLKENFEASMDAVGISALNQERFFESFEDTFGMNISDFTLDNKYKFEIEPKHWIAFDQGDLIAPYQYLKAFAENHPAIALTEYEGEGHQKILRSAKLITDVITPIKSALSV